MASLIIYCVHGKSVWANCLRHHLDSIQHSVKEIQQDERETGNEIKSMQYELNMKFYIAR